MALPMTLLLSKYSSLSNRLVHNIAKAAANDRHHGEKHRQRQPSAAQDLELIEREIRKESRDKQRPKPQIPHPNQGQHKQTIGNASRKPHGIRRIPRFGRRNKLSNPSFMIESLDGIAYAQKVVFQKNIFGRVWAERTGCAYRVVWIDSMTQKKRYRAN
jgi:hypothetical protein